MKNLAIVGSHERTRSQAPFDDPDYDIWVFNEAPQAAWCKRWDVCFQLHKPEVYESVNNFVRSDHWTWLQECHGSRQIFMQDYDSRVPNSKRYPLGEIIDSLPGAHLRWFRSSAAYAIALALYQGWEHIALYGLDLASNTEYGYQLSNYQFWVGIAFGMGVQIEMISNERFFTGALYGYEGETQIDRQHFEQRAATLADENSRADWEVKKARNKLEEAIREYKLLKVGELIADYQDAVINMAQHNGALDEARRYAARPDPVPRQEFERRAAQAQLDAEDDRREMWKAAGECQYVWNIWNQTGSLQARNQLRVFVEKQMRYAKVHGYQSGKMRENMDYMLLVDDLITAAGGQKTVAALGGVHG